LSVVAIICEYNPFHNGHKYQIETQKKENDSVIALMSGNFVQRGEPALCDKWKRAEMALAGGVDLVIELPVVYATQSAERFARGAALLADSLGVVDYLSFGCECDNLALLYDAAKNVQKKETNDKIAEFLKNGMSYPAARTLASGDEYAKILSEPNNILAIEYLKALSEIKSSIIPKPILRKGCAHDAKQPEGNFASASYIRNAVKNREVFDGFIPGTSAEILNSADVFRDKKALDSVLTYLLRTMSQVQLAEIADMTEGLEYRFIDAAKNVCTFDDISSFVKTKRYTKTRIDRLLINVLLSIKKDDIGKKPGYIRILGFSEKGRQLLSDIKKKTNLPIITKVADADLTGDAYEMFMKDIYATDIYSMLTMKSENHKSGLDYVKSPIIKK